MPPSRHSVGTKRFHYDPNAGPFATIFRCGHSVVPVVLRRFDFWVLLAYHLAVWLAFNYGPWPAPDTEWGKYAKLDWNDVKVLTALTTFFEVFYTNACFSRYQNLYATTRQILVTAQHLSLELRLQLMGGCASHARLSLRYLLASLLLFFEDEVQVGIIGRTKLMKNLLRPEEQDFLRRTPSCRSLVAAQWCCQVFLLGAKKASLTPAAIKSVMDKIAKEQAALRKLADALALPVPFQYFHLLNLMVLVCILSWGFVMGATASICGIPVFIVSALIFMGMIQLASQLSDPFGDDAVFLLYEQRSRIAIARLQSKVDFPLDDWILESFRLCESVLEYEHPGGTDAHDAEWDSRLARETCLDLKLEALDDEGSDSELGGGCLGARPGQAYNPLRRTLIRVDACDADGDEDDDPAD